MNQQVYNRKNNEENFEYSLNELSNGGAGAGINGAVSGLTQQNMGAQNMQVGVTPNNNDLLFNS